MAPPKPTPPRPTHLPLRFSDLKPGLQHEIVEYARGHGVRAASLRYNVKPSAVGASLAARTQSTKRRQAKLVALYAPKENLCSGNSGNGS